MSGSGSHHVIVSKVDGLPEMSARKLESLRNQTQAELDKLENAGPFKKAARSVAKIGVGALAAGATMLGFYKLFLEKQEEIVDSQNDHLEQATPTGKPKPKYFGELKPIEGKLSDVDLKEEIVVAPCRNCFCGGMGGVCRPVKATDERDTTIGYKGGTFRRLGEAEVGEYLSKNPQFDTLDAYKEGFPETAHFHKKFNEIQERLGESAQGVDASQAPDEASKTATHQARADAERSQTALQRQTAFSAGSAVAVGAVGISLSQKLMDKLPQNRIKKLSCELKQIDEEIGYRERVKQDKKQPAMEHAR